MNKFAALVWLMAVAIAALGLYHVKYEVQRLEEDLGLEHQSILKHQEAIHILKAEWSYLNQPARISDLAKRHLGLAPLTAKQIVRFDELPMRRQHLSGNLPDNNLKARVAGTRRSPP